MLFLLSYNVLQGQSFYGGVMVGINGSQVFNDEFSGYHKFGVFGGGFVGWKFTPMSALKMELEFSQKGSRETPTEENDYKDYKIHINCIDLPVLYQLFYNIATQKFSIEVGPSFTYIIGDPKEEGTDGTGYYYIEGGTGRPFISSGLNIVAGVNYHITKNLFVNFRTSNSITPIRKDYGRRQHPIFRWHGQSNDVLTLSVGWDFGKGAIRD
jgi:hypothetical protein